MPPAPLLGQARIVMDQAGNTTPGVAGRSRNDGVTGAVVTVRNADNGDVGVGKYKWTLEKPRGSTAVLSSPSSASCQFTPDLIGSYMVTLAVNEGTGTNQKQKRIFGVKSASGLRLPGQGEGAEANWLSIWTGAPNETGWWEDLIALMVGVAESPKVGVTAVDGPPENLLAVRTSGASQVNAAKVGQVNLGTDDPDPLGTNGDYAAILSGLNNSATGDYSIIAGGNSNQTAGTCSFVGGGQQCVVQGDYSVIAGGESCQITGDHSTIGGGQTNAIIGDHCTIGGGSANGASGVAATVGGGTQNSASGDYSVIAGGTENSAEGDYGAVIGGIACQAKGAYSIAGGRGAIAFADYAVALNRSALATYEGSVVIKDGTVTTVATTVAQQLIMSFTGGMRLLFPGSTLRRSGYSSANNYVTDVHGSASSTDATPAVSTLITIPSGQDCHIKGVLKGKQSGTAAARVLFFEASYTNNGGTVALVDAAFANDSKSNGAGATWVTAVSINGAALEVAFTGAAATTVRWTWNFTASIGGAT